jgi:pimeloyl-ACP methyl ester carboxylesterase
MRRTFTASDGITLVGDGHGDPSHPPVLLMHGGGQTRHAWGGTARVLARHGWYAVCVDLRGHGDSGWSPAGNYSLDVFARDMVTLARGLARPPALVGASLSGLAALIAQGEAEAALFSALVLVDVTPRLDPAGTQHILQFMSAHLADGFATLEEAADTIAAYVPHRQRPKNLDGLAKNLRRHPDGRYRWHWDPQFMLGKKPPDVHSQHDRLFTAARNLRIPTLLVRGRMSDLVTVEAAEEFLTLAPHAKFADVSGAGHMVAGDRNDAFTAAVAEFLGDAVVEDEGRKTKE